MVPSALTTAVAPAGPARDHNRSADRAAVVGSHVDGHGDVERGQRNIVDSIRANGDRHRARRAQRNGGVVATFHDE